MRPGLRDAASGDATGHTVSEFEEVISTHDLPRAVSASTFETGADPAASREPPRGWNHA